MRVVHFSTCHQPQDVRVFHKECRSLADEGYEVIYLVADAPRTSLKGVGFADLQRPSGGWRALRIFRRLAEVYRQALALAADIYHFHDPELIPVGILLHRAGARVIYDVHEDSPREALALNRDRPWEGRAKSLVWGLFEAAARACLDGFVGATPGIAAKFPAERTVTVRNFPRLEEFAAQSDASVPTAAAQIQTNRIIYVGGLTIIRGVREMVDSMACLPESGTRLSLLGTFHPASLQTELANGPGWQHVDYLGWQARDRLVEEMTRARIGLLVLHPEQIHLESLPIKLFEYMAAGLPVVASDFPLWREIIEAAQCGVLVNPLEPEAIAAAVQSLLADPQKAREMGNRGRVAVQTEFNWSTESRKLIELYGRMGRREELRRAA